MTSHKILKSLTVTAALLAAALTAAPERAQASLILDDVVVELDTGAFAGVLTDVVTVGSGVEISNGDGTNIGGVLFPGESVDIDDSSITFVFTGAISYPWEFRDLQWRDSLGNVVPGLLTAVVPTLVSGTISPFPPSITILSPPDSNVPQAFRVIPAVPVGSTATLRLDLVVDKPFTPLPMAEPGTISLLLVALTGLVVARGRGGRT